MPLLGLPAVAQTTGESQPAGQSPQQMRERGLELVYASNVMTPEAQQGLGLLEAAAAAGDVQAEIAIGKLYLYGTVLPKNWDKARAHFERAVEQGDASGLAEYGMMLMWSERDWRGAQQILERAAGLGVTSAWVTLAEGAMYGYLGGGSASRARFEGYAEKARAAGQQQITLLEADRMMWGISMPASGPKALAHLQAAADAGNGAAARRLVALLRQGNKLNIRKDSAAARAALAKYAPLFTETDLWRMETGIQAAERRTQAALAQLRDTVDSRPELMTKDFAADLVEANQNAAIYLLQARLNAAGYGSGKLDGLAGPVTLRAMTAACRKILPPARCEDSMLQKDIIAGLIAAL